MPEHQQPGEPVKVVFAYEDDVAFDAARGIYCRVAGRLVAEFEFRDVWWCFAALAQPQLFERAVGLAAGADVVFCCPSNPHVLPGLVQSWIRRWLAQRTQPDGALVVLLPVITGQASSPTLLERDLRETARAGGLAFFATHYSPESAQDAASGPAQSPNLLGKDLNVASAKEHGTGAQHWGINE